MLIYKMYWMPDFVINTYKVLILESDLFTSSQYTYYKFLQLK